MKPCLSIRALWPLLLTLVSLLLVTCTAAQRQAPVHALHVSAEECVHLATVYGRADVAAACGVGDSVAPILEGLLAQTEKQSRVMALECRVNLPPRDAGVEQ